MRAAVSRCKVILAMPSDGQLRPRAMMAAAEPICLVLRWAILAAANAYRQQRATAASTTFAGLAMAVWSLRYEARVMAQKPGVEQIASGSAVS